MNPYKAQFFIETLENLKKEILADGYVPTIDEAIERLKLEL